MIHPTRKKCNSAVCYTCSTECLTNNRPGVYDRAMTTDHYDPSGLRQAMKLAGYTQQELADRLRIHRATVARALAGEKVSYEMLSRLCQTLGVDVVRLLHPRGRRVA